AAAFDIGAACAGWLYAMSTAEGLIMSGTAETALVIGSEKMSAIVDWKDRSTCELFGDGAGAAVLKRSRHHGKGILSAYMRGDGKAFRHIDGQGLRQRRQVRQYIFGFDPHRAGRSDRIGQSQRGYDRDDGRLRRRIHLGVDGHPLLSGGHRTALSRPGLAEAGNGKGPR